MNKHTDIREIGELTKLVQKYPTLSRELCDEFVSKGSDINYAFRRGIVIGSVAVRMGADVAQVKTEKGTYYFIVRPDLGVEREANTLDWWLRWIQREAEKEAGKSSNEIRTEELTR